MCPVDTGQSHVNLIPTNVRFTYSCHGIWDVLFPLLRVRVVSLKKFCLLKNTVTLHLASLKNAKTEGKLLGVDEVDPIIKNESRVQAQCCAFIFNWFHQLMDLLKGGIELKGEIEQANIVLVFEYPILNNTKGRTLVKWRKLDHV